MATAARPLAVVTGASTGIGLELAKLCAQNGFDLVIAADEPRIDTAAQELRTLGAWVDAVQADSSTIEGVDKLIASIGGRPVAALLANAGRGLGQAFLDQDFDDIARVIDTNVTGTVYLVHEVGRGNARTPDGADPHHGSIAGYMPGTYQAVYNGTKAFLDSFAFALRHELKDAGVTVTCLIPGPTETEFFERAGMMDTKVGTEKKQPADEVAKVGFEAMMNGEGDAIAGWQNKFQAAFAHVDAGGRASPRCTPEQAAPGTARKS